MCLVGEHHPHGVHTGGHETGFLFGAARQLACLLHENCIAYIQPHFSQKDGLEYAQGRPLAAGFFVSKG
jgi:hypothetical protein